MTDDRQPTTHGKEWNAARYHQVSTPQVSWGKKVLSRVSLRGDECLLDAGCGTGRLTRDLLEALPNGQVVALDVSQNMLDTARAYLEPDFGARVRFVRCDLLELSLDREFDGIFSTASFHWILDHDRLFGNLYRALRPGGWLIAQCGGRKNLDRLFARVKQLTDGPVYARYFDGYTPPLEFSDAETAAERMRRAGFAEIETSLEEAPTSFPTASEYQEFVETVVLRTHLPRIPEAAIREQFLAEVTRQAAADTPPFTLDYWRLNLQGRKADASR
jgi:trans-aconitate methyltransferase